MREDIIVEAQSAVSKHRFRNNGAVRVLIIQERCYVLLPIMSIAVRDNAPTDLAPAGWSCKHAGKHSERKKKGKGKTKCPAAEILLSLA